MKIAIFTIIDRGPGARLQNYALQQFLISEFNAEVRTIKRINYFYEKINLRSILKYRSHKDLIKYIINYKNYRKWLSNEFAVQKNWLEFDKNIYFTDKIMKKEYGPIDKSFNEDFDYFIVGSDQVYNPYWFPDIDFFKYIDKKKRIAYAASFGVSSIPSSLSEHFRNTLNGMEYISVREEAGAKIVKNLTGKDVPVLVDPTLLLTKDEWLGVAKRPEWYKKEDYIVAFFLGDISTIRQEQIENIARQLNAKIIYPLKNLNSNWNKIGPAEFIYLIANSKAVLTDSFHGTVFSIIMNIPFFVFNREPEGLFNMNSRIESLLNLFNMKERYIMHNKYIEEDINNIDFSAVDSVQYNSKIYSIKYLKRAMNIE